MGDLSTLERIALSGALFFFGYLLIMIQAHLSAIRDKLDRHQDVSEELLQEIAYNTSQTTDSIQDLQP